VLVQTLPVDLEVLGVDVWSREPNSRTTRSMSIICQTRWEGSRLSPRVSSSNQPKISRQVAGA
jgi:hypothetical protein